MEQTHVEQIEDIEVDKAIELKAMANMLNRAEGFTLAFALCNFPNERKELVSELRQMLDDYAITEIEFEKPIENLINELIPRLPEHSKAIFIYGLERSIDPDKSSPLVGNLNISRNLFPKYISCPFVIWIPAYALSVIMRHAPDFFSWRSSIFQFQSAPEKVFQMSGQMASEGSMAVSNLTVKEKEERIKAIKNLLDDYQSLPPDESNRRSQAMLMSRLGEIYWMIGKPEEAIEYLQQALMMDREIGDRQEEGIGLGNLGNAYADKGQLGKTIEYQKHALEIAKEFKDKQNESTWLGNLGAAYADMGQLEKAIEYYQQALVINREIGNKRSEGIRLGNLGSAYYSLGQIEKAIEYYQQALVIDKEIGDKRGEGVDLGSLGNAYNEIGQLEKAIEYHQQALVIAKEIGDKQNEGLWLGNLGSAYIRLGQLDKAREYLNQALAIAREIIYPRLEDFVLEKLETLKDDNQD